MSEGFFQWGGRSIREITQIMSVRREWSCSDIGNKIHGRVNRETVAHARVVPRVVPRNHSASRLFAMKQVERRNPVLTLVFAVEERPRRGAVPKIRPRRH